MIERLRAVALIVANPAGEVLILQELIDKPHLGKFSGMYSIPMETCKPGERTFSALQRLHDEELAGLPSVQVPGRYIGVYRVVPGAWVWLHATMSATYHLPPLSGDQEVGNHQWMSIQEALGLWLRRGALEMIQDYAGGLENVLRRECIRPRIPVRV